MFGLNIKLNIILLLESQIYRRAGLMNIYSQVCPVHPDNMKGYIKVLINNDTSASIVSTILPS